MFARMEKGKHGRSRAKWDDVQKPGKWFVYIWSAKLRTTNKTAQKKQEKLKKIVRGGGHNMTVQTGSTGDDPWS